MKNSSQNYHIKLAIPFCLLLILFLLFTFQTANAQNLRIYHIDVEQGDATLFISPTGKTMLVDSGGNGRGSRIKAVMQDAGVSRIDQSDSKTIFSSKIFLNSSPLIHWELGF